MIQTSWLLIKDGIGNLKPTYLLKSLEIEDMGHTPHPNRAANRITTNKAGKPNCQQRIRTIFLLPIEASGCTVRK
jgi:hypothetical protein